MTSVIVVLPKIDDAKNMKNLLVRNGISVAGACTTGAQAIALADNLNDGIVLCGYKLTDMIYSQLQEYLPPGFEMLLIASQHIISGGMIEGGIICLSMPLKVHDLINSIDMMIQTIERRRSRLKTKPKERSEEEKELIKNAKDVLMNRNHMTEEEAHKYMQKCSMDSGTNMVETAQMILTMMKG
ncbi:MAG: ANTAR domain-containing protein [Lachnospiraceae bacterium]|nr:ANTAR domain-containing protein [Lachnospiraceae bacterium]